MLNQGFVDWLHWLSKAQQEPTVVISNRIEEVREMFASGRAAYFVGDSTDLPDLVEVLGDRVGVKMLPMNDTKVVRK